MPSFRRVSFSDRNHYSRLPHDDELYVMKAFARHADNCDSCYNPYQVYKDGSTLCPRGHQKAIDVAQYVYSKGGQAYSQVDQERHQRVQIEIPANCESVRQLLKALDRGLRVMRELPPTSYDRTYYVPARLSVPDNHCSAPATRPSISNSGWPTKSMKWPQIEPTLQPRESRSRSRPRATSTGSNSSTGSYGPRTSRPCFVRPRSKDGKRGHSPIYIRPGISRLSSDNKEARLKSSHSRNNSYSSSSSRSSSIFSSGHSRNSSISSQDSHRDQPPTVVPVKGSLSKVAFRDPNYDAPIFRTIVPKDGKEVPPRSSHIHGSRRHRRRE